MKKIFVAIILITVLLVGFASCGFTVEEPKIKSGEFDFKVTYEFQGEVKTVSGVYVCEYSGTSWALDGGSHRTWTGHIKGGEESDVFEIGATEDGGTVELRLNLYPNYFMGDFIEDDSAISKPAIAVMLVTEEGTSILLEPEDVEAYCGAKIISYEYEEPIENSFE